MRRHIQSAERKRFTVNNFIFSIAILKKARGKLGYSRINKNREFIALKPALPQILKGALQTEMKEH